MNSASFQQISSSAACVGDSGTRSLAQSEPCLDFRERNVTSFCARRLVCRRLASTLLLALTLPLTGCLAAYVVGGAVKAGQKKVDLVMSPGVSATTLAAKKNIGISVNGGGNSQQLAFGGGGSNTNVYADMLTREFLRLGYSTRTVTETVSEATTSRQIRELGEKGFDLILICNLNFSTTSNMAGAMIGTDYMKTGVTSFTLKGFDPRSGNTLFIASAEYGTAKAAGTVAEDMSALYRDVVTGTVKSTSGAVAPAASSTRATDDARPSGATVQAPTGSAPQSAPRTLSPSGVRSVPTSVPRTVPVLVSPGMRAAPGPMISSAAVSLTWSEVENATGYAVSVKDMTANAVIFSAEVEADDAKLQIPSGKLIAGHAYRWSTRARNAEGYGAYAPYLFFRR